MTFVSKKFYLFLTITPLFALGIFYSFVLRAYIILDRLPAPYQPDPKDLDFYIHMWLILLSATFTYAALVPWIFITNKLWKEKIFSRKFLLTNIVIYIISFLSLILIIKLDPGRFIEWFLD